MIPLYPPCGVGKTTIVSKGFFATGNDGANQGANRFGIADVLVCQEHFDFGSSSGLGGIPVTTSGTNGPGKYIQDERPAAPHQQRGTFGRTVRPAENAGPR